MRGIAYPVFLLEAALPAGSEQGICNPEMSSSGGMQNYAFTEIFSASSCRKLALALGVFTCSRRLAFFAGKKT